MKKYRFLRALTFIGAIAVSPIVAQQKPAPQATKPAPQATAPAAAPSTAAVPESKIALINSELWADEKGGIVRLVAAMKRVHRREQCR